MKSTGDVTKVFEDHLLSTQRQTDRLFAWLLGGQWLFALFCAFAVSPRTWAGAQSAVHIHVWTALVLGGLLSLLPVWLALAAPGRLVTRLVVASAQIMFSALLIHLMAGRIEAHFHVFGSLAILAFYRDWRVFVPAVTLVLVDHLFRGIMWPESVFGVVTAAPWRAFEHAGWVVFESVFLLVGIHESRQQLWELSRLQVSLSDERDQLETRVEERTADLVEERRQLEVAKSKAEELAEALWSSQESLDLAVSGAELGLWQWDLQSDRVDFGARCEPLLGYETGELSPHFDTFRELAHPDDRAVLQEKLDEHFRDPAALFECELRMLSGAGEYVWVHTRGRIAKTASEGAPRLMAGILSDVTERKQLEARLLQAQKLESVGQLAAGVAHEINTPMQFINDNLEFLKEGAAGLLEILDAYDALIQPGEPPADWQEARSAALRLQDEHRYGFLRDQLTAALDESIEGAQRVVTIVRAMKEFSHPGGGEMTWADLNQALRSAATVSRNRWKYVAELELDLDDSLPQVLCLPAEINQVLLNLIVNAADAIAEKVGPDAERQERIVARTRRRGGSVTIEVEDTGSGIPEEIRARVFDPFFTTKQVGKGTGQGLSICQNVVVNRHQGVIDVRSTPGAGSTFIVTLPIGGAHGATLGVDGSSEDAIGYDDDESVALGEECPLFVD